MFSKGLNGGYGRLIHGVEKLPCTEAFMRGCG